MTHYDVIIIGGGVVGATLACAMAPASLRIALLERNPPSEPHPGAIDLRVSAITEVSQCIFKALDAWSGMTKRRISPFHEMRVWDAGGKGMVHFDAADIGRTTLGHIIENRVMLSALWERLRKQDRVELLCPAIPVALVRSGSDWSISLQDGRRLSAHLVVGADGPQSEVRAWAHIGTHGWSYDQQAVVANVGTENPHQETAWQRFLSTGPLAFLPLSDGRSSIVWTTTLEQAQRLLGSDEESFKALLAEAFAHRLGRITVTSERMTFPLSLQYVENYVAAGLALIGDAAHTVHPLAGQGMNLGLLDAVTLAEVVMDACAEGKDYASYAVLRRYERRRKGPNLLMMAAVDGFKRLFGNTSTPVRMARNTGLRLIEVAQPIKNEIMRYAIGESRDLPRLIASPLFY